MKVFTEKHDNLIFQYPIDTVHIEHQSKMQFIGIYENASVGRFLVIDDCIMLTELDEFVYHEMMAHIPLLHHPKPESVLVVGGGDGGLAREILKYPSIASLVLCEIDEDVTKLSRRYLPTLASGFDDKRVTLKFADGIDYIRHAASASFDMIFVDSTDPDGLAEPLFSGDFYAACAAALKDDGIFVCQSESPWYDRELLMGIQDRISQGFPNRKTYWGSVPTYPLGSWTWTIAGRRHLPKLPEALDA